MNALQETFIENRVGMIGKVLGIKFTGTSIEEKEEFFKKHEEKLNATTSNILTSVYDVYAGKVKVFQVNHFEWVAAKSLEDAIKFHLKTTGLDEEEALEDPHEITNLESFKVTLDKMVEGDELYESLGHLQEKYLNSENENTFKVPAIELLFQEWQGEPYLLCSKKHI